MTDLRFAFAPTTLRAPLLAWYRRVARPLPWRVRFAEHGDPYHVWVSEIMLQQTVIKAVLPVYERFLARFPTVVDLARADDESVRQAVRGLGYYRRFCFLHQAAKVLTATTPVEWPDTFDGWRDLPGVGDYTAAAVCSIAFGFPAAVVDGNVERVFARLLDLRESPAESRFKRRFKVLAAEFLEPKAAGDFNQALMELGQTVCTVTSPACGVCPLASGCLSRERGSQALAPAPKAKPVTKDVTMRLLVPETRGLIGLVERPSGARFLSGTYGFVTVIVDGSASSSNTGASLGKFKHSITHHRIAASVERVGRDAIPDDAVVRWVKPDAVEEQLISNLDRKAWRLCAERMAQGVS